MNTFLKYLIMLLLITSCNGDYKKEKGIDLFKTKIKDIQLDISITEEQKLDNIFFLSYSIKDYKKLQIHFLWKNNYYVDLKTLTVLFGDKNEYYYCFFDKTNFSDMEVNDTIMIKTIDLESAHFVSAKSKISYSSNDFFRRIIASNKIIIYAMIDDSTLMANRLRSDFTRSSKNTITITLQNNEEKSINKRGDSK